VDGYVEANRAWWDELVPLHAASGFYDLIGFKGGRSSLDGIERSEVGDVTGCSLLHLQCHFGLDTLSWARLGAHVTGVDFSAPAIELARTLTSELDLDARFFCCDLEALASQLPQRFDIVFSSYGVLSWLPDLRQWADVVADHLVPGGRFHLIELHPFAGMFDDQVEDLRVRFPYFRSHEPIRVERPGSYAVPGAPTTNQVTWSWPAPTSEVITALLDAGLSIESFREYPSCHEQLLANLVRDDGRWRSPPDEPQLPLVYAIRASRPAERT
jgi:SAM-dependent methyltransferase